MIRLSTSDLANICSCTTWPRCLSQAGEGLYFEFINILIFDDVIGFEFSFVVPPGTGEDTLDRSIDRFPRILPRSNLPASRFRWRMMESRHIIAVVRTLPADLAWA